MTNSAEPQVQARRGVLNNFSEKVNLLFLPDSDVLTDRSRNAPLDEQVGIATWLDVKTTEIDVVRERVRVSIELLREYRTTLISAAVMGKMDVQTSIIAPKELEDELK